MDTLDRFSTWLSLYKDEQESVESLIDTLYTYGISMRHVVEITKAAGPVIIEKSLDYAIRKIHKPSVKETFENVFELDATEWERLFRSMCDVAKRYYLLLWREVTNNDRTQNQTEWIDITPETMPPKDTAIHAAIRKGGRTVVGMFPVVWRDGEFFGTTMSNDAPGTIELHRVNGKVTHWMPWPEPPQ